MSECIHPLCDRTVAQGMDYCCEACEEAARCRYPADRHLPECNLREMAVRDPVVGAFCEVYDTLAEKLPGLWEYWRRMRERYEVSDLGLSDPADMDVFAASLQHFRRSVKEGFCYSIIGVRGLVMDRTGQVTCEFWRAEKERQAFSHVMGLHFECVESLYKDFQGGDE